MGEIILAQYKNGVSYRAVVTEVLQDKSVCVRFVDYGDEATVAAADLRELSEEINQVKKTFFGHSGFIFIACNRF